MSIEQTKKEMEEIKLFLKGVSHWNGGAGLIVPEDLGNRLEEMGFTEGYTKSVNINNH